MSARGSMLLVGVGGAGCHALGRLRERWSEAPSCLAVHTDAQVLGACGIDEQLPLGGQAVRGLSTGGDPEAGGRAAEASAEALRERIAGHDLAVVLAGLGGGTGGGAGPVVAAAARDAGALTLAFCTMPFFFEGPQRRLRAEAALERIREAADAVMVLPNQRILEWIDDRAGPEHAFRLADDIVGSSLRAVWRLLAHTGLINLDFADLRRLVERSGGTLCMATAEAEGASREKDVVDRLAASPLLDHGNVIARADGLLVGLVGGPDMTLFELEHTMARVTALARPDIDLHLGMAVDPEYAGRLALTLVATEARGAGTPARGTASAEGPVPAAAQEEAPVAPPARPPRRRAGRPVQADLPFERAGKGRFKDVEPTIHGGQDLDVPTFLRRGLRLSRP